MALADYRVAWHCHGHAHPDRNLHRPHCALPHVQKVFPLWVHVLNTRLPEDACGQGNLRLDDVVTSLDDLDRFQVRRPLVKLARSHTYTANAPCLRLPGPLPHPFTTAGGHATNKGRDIYSTHHA